MKNGRYLGTFHARTDSDGLWHVQTVAERHTTLDAPSGWSVGRTAPRPRRSSAGKLDVLPGPGVEEAVLAACLEPGLCEDPDPF